SGVARHEMRFDQARCDFQIGFDEAFVEAHHRAARCGGAEHDMLGVFGRVMVLDLRRVEHPGVADQLIELRSKVRPMQAGGDQHPKGFRWNAGLEQGLDQWTKKEAIWYRPRNVADGDGSTSCSPGQLLERSH